MLPGRQQRVGQQRQCPGRPADRRSISAVRQAGVGDTEVAQQRFDQAVFQGEADPPGRSDDDLTELLAAHRADHDLPAGEGRQQLGVVRAATVEVSPHPHNHDGGGWQATLPVPVAGAGAGVGGGRGWGAGGDQGADERLPVGVGDLGGEQFLELVDDEQHPPGRDPLRLVVGAGWGRGGQRGVQMPADAGGVGGVGGQGGAQPVGRLASRAGQDGGKPAQRVGTGNQNQLGPLPGAGCRLVDAVGQRGQHPGAQQGGFPRTGGADDHQRPGMVEPVRELRHHLGDQLVAAEEEPGVPPAVGGQPPVGADVVRHYRGAVIPLVPAGVGRLVGPVVGQQQVPGLAAGMAPGFGTARRGQHPGQIPVDRLQGQLRRAGRVPPIQQVQQRPGEHGVPGAGRGQRRLVPGRRGQQVAVAYRGHREHVVAAGDHSGRGPAGETAVQHHDHRPGLAVGHDVPDPPVGQGLLIGCGRSRPGEVLGGGGRQMQLAGGVEHAVADVVHHQ